MYFPVCNFLHILNGPILTLNIIFIQSSVFSLNLAKILPTCEFIFSTPASNFFPAFKKSVITYKPWTSFFPTFPISLSRSSKLWSATLTHSLSLGLQRLYLCLSLSEKSCDPKAVLCSSEASEMRKQKAKHHSTWGHFWVRTGDPDSPTEHQHHTKPKCRKSGWHSFQRERLMERAGQGGMPCSHHASLHLLIALLSYLPWSLRLLMGTTVISVVENETQAAYFLVNFGVKIKDITLMNPSFLRNYFSGAGRL